MEEEQGNSFEDLHHELDVLDSRSTLSDKEAEARFITWYEDICQERMTMLEAEENFKKKVSELETAEEGYRARIKELETNTMVLVKTFEEAQSEINILREKYEPDADSNAYLESYKTVAMERNTLLKSESQNKKRIKDLEVEIKQLRNYIQDDKSLEDKNKKKLGRKNQVEKLVVVTGAERLTTLQTENVNLRNKLERMRKTNKSLVFKTKHVETEIKTEETYPIKQEKQPKEKIVINKNCIPTFLPRIENVSPRVVSDAERLRPVPYFHRSLQTPTLMFGLGYCDIYRKGLLQKSKPFHTTSLSSSQFDSISKYMI